MNIGIQISGRDFFFFFLTLIWLAPTRRAASNAKGEWPHHKGAGIGRESEPLH